MHLISTVHFIIDSGNESLNVDASVIHYSKSNFLHSIVVIYITQVIGILFFYGSFMRFLELIVVNEDNDRNGMFQFHLGELHVARGIEPLS